MICIVADLFQEDYQGGAEIACSALIELLRPHDKVIQKHCQEVTPEFIAGFNGKLIVSNRQHLSEASKIELYKKDYILWEHDFHYLKSRDAGLYEDLKAPEDQLINTEIYQHAKKVVCQSTAQLHAYRVNLNLDNGISTAGNPWSKSDLNYLKNLQDVEKSQAYAVLFHQFPTKGTDDAVQFCKNNDWKCNIIPPMPHKEFLKELAKYKVLVFLPQIFETYSRICFEARALNVDLLLNDKIGFKYEEHSILKGLSLIKYAEENNEKIRKLFYE